MSWSGCVRFDFGLAAAAVCLCAAPAWSQATVRLRSGGYKSTYRIVGLSSPGPAVVTVKNYAGDSRHDLSVGDTVFLQNVQGCPAANGYRKVSTADQASGTAALLYEDGKPVQCEAAFIAGNDVARLGKVQPFTLAGHPRLLIPDTGAARTRVTDPDGKGRRRAPAADERIPAWEGLLRRYTTSVPSFDASCDGVTPARCPKAEARMSSDGVTLGWDIFNVALMWQMDQGQSDWLASVKYWLNHIERTPQYLTKKGPLTAVLPHAAVGGRGSDPDWISESMMTVSAAYSIVRSEMSPGERAALAAKVLNGLGDRPCEASMSSAQGPGSMEAGGKQLRGSGFSGLRPGDHVLVAERKRGTGAFIWAKVQSVINDSTVELDTPARAPMADALVLHTPPLAQSFAAWGNKCGMAYLANHHGAFVPYANPVQIVRLAEPLSATATVVTLTPDHPAITLATPFYLTIGVESMLVTARQRDKLTVVRGQLYTEPKAYKAGANVSATRYPIRLLGQWPFAATGDWQHNLNLNRQQGFIAAALAFAEDDERAMQMLPAAWAFWHDYTFFDIQRTWTIRGPGGLTLGYQMGRWGDMTSHIAAMIANSTGLNTFGGYLKRYAYLPIYSQWPNMLGGPGGSNWKEESDDYHWLPIHQHFFNGSDEQKYVRFWFDSVAEFNRPAVYGGNSGKEHAGLRLIYTAPNDPAVDYRKSLDPWIFATQADFGSTPFGLIVSKSDWTPAATMLWINAVSLSTDHDYSDGTFKMAGDYALYRGKSLIGGGKAGVVGSDAAGNFFEIGGTYGGRRIGTTNWNEVNPSAEGGDRTEISQTKATAEWLHVRLDLKDFWRSRLGVKRAIRHFVHLKGGPEYVIVFDDVLTASSNQKRTRVHYHTVGEQSPDFARAGNQMKLRKPSGEDAAMISTQLVFPDGSSPQVTDSQTATATAVVVDWGSVPSAQMITVHRPALGVADEMSAARLLTDTDPQSLGIEVGSGSGARSVTFSRDGSLRSAATFTTSFEGQGRCLATGLTSGNYDVVRSGAVAHASQAVAEDATLSFACQGGGSVRWRIQKRSR